MIRVNLDVQVEDGNEEELVKMLADPAVMKGVADYMVNVSVANKLEKTKVDLRPRGGFAHVHTADGGFACEHCVSTAVLLVHKKFPR